MLNLSIQIFSSLCVYMFLLCFLQTVPTTGRVNYHGLGKAVFEFISEGPEALTDVLFHKGQCLQKPVAQMSMDLTVSVSACP